MWRVALLWNPLGRLPGVRLSRTLSTTRATLPRVLPVVVLVGALVVVGPAAVHSGREVVGRAPALARQLVTVVATRLAVGSEQSCQPQGWMPPPLSIGDEPATRSDLLWMESGCNGW